MKLRKQPEKHTNERTETHASDLISRQAAIEAVSGCGADMRGVEDGKA